MKKFKMNLTQSSVKLGMLFIAGLLFFSSCQKEESQDEVFARFEKTYNVKISKNILKSAPKDNILEIKSLTELEQELKLIKKATNIHIVTAEERAQKKRLKIFDYIYNDDEVGGGGGNDVFGELQFTYPCIVSSFCQFNVLPNFNYNTSSKNFSDFGISTTGYTGQYSATLYAHSTYYGAYTASITYHVTITRNFIYQGAPIGTSFNRHYTIYINRATGQIINGVEY